MVGDAPQPRVFEHMKRAVERLKLHRKIVLVADEASEFLAVMRDDDCGASARIEVVVGLSDRKQDLGWFARPGVVREIRSEEASRAGSRVDDAVTFRARRLAKEKYFAGG